MALAGGMEKKGESIHRGWEIINHLPQYKSALCKVNVFLMEHRKSNKFLTAETEK